MRCLSLAAVLFAYLLGLIATLPATFLDTRLQRISNGTLRISEAQGTLWSGTGQFEIRDENQRAGVAKRVEWRLLPNSILHGNLQYEITVDRLAKSLHLTMLWSQINLSQIDLNLPASALGIVIPQVAALGLSGNLNVQSEKLIFEGHKLQGEAKVQWHTAGSKLTQIAPLGDYELQFKGDRYTIFASLHTLNGPLQLDGKGTWENGSNPVFHATARISPQHQQQLAPLLRLIAIERSESHFEIQLKTP